MGQLPFFSPTHEIECQRRISVEYARQMSSATTLRVFNKQPFITNYNKIAGNNSHVFSGEDL